MTPSCPCRPFDALDGAPTASRQKVVGTCTTLRCSDAPFTAAKKSWDRRLAVFLAAGLPMYGPVGACTAACTRLAQLCSSGFGVKWCPAVLHFAHLTV